MRGSRVKRIEGLTYVEMGSDSPDMMDSEDPQRCGRPRVG